ncbi:MAG: hypothetical protein K0S65_6620 [Labilithrix sp.]|nr:hypothetical protein [Labilithrix sp.]
MQVVKEQITAWQNVFAQHPFFARLEQQPTEGPAFVFAPALMFWIMGFQDVLRLNEDFTSDPLVKRFAAQHREEDSEHWSWFLDDLTTLGVTDRDVTFLFGAGHRATRDATYRILSEVYQIKDDRLRIPLILSLESTAHVFFTRVADYAQRLGLRDRLRFFGNQHLDAEESHEFYGDENQRVDDMPLPENLRVEASAMVERIHRAFLTMFDDHAFALPSIPIENLGMPGRDRAVSVVSPVAFD